MCDCTQSAAATVCGYEFNSFVELENNSQDLGLNVASNISSCAVISSRTDDLRDDLDHPSNLNQLLCMNLFFIRLHDIRPDLCSQYPATQKA